MANLGFKRWSKQRKDKAQARREAMTVRFCNKCLRNLPVAMFHPRKITKRNKMPWRSRCKTCEAADNLESFLSTYVPKEKDTLFVMSIDDIAKAMGINRSIVYRDLISGLEKVKATGWLDEWRHG